MPDKLLIERERKVITYSDLWRTSGYLLECGQNNQRGSYFMFLSSLMFSAFSLEAFLNHVGENIFTSWQELEKLSPKGKLNVICEKLGLEPNYGQTPWQIVPQIIGFRNKVAHGKNTFLKEEKIIPYTEKYEEIMHEFLMADWQEYANQNNAEQVRIHLEKLYKDVHGAAGLENDFLFNHGLQTGTTKLIQD